MTRAAITLFILSCPLFLLSSCQKQTIPDPIPPTVILSEADNGWVVEYHLAAPVGALIFPRSDDRPRSETWSLTTPGTLKRSRYFDAIIAESPSRYFKLVVKPDFHIAQHDYSPFLKFQNGGRAVFTGQFEVLAASSESSIASLKPDLSNYSGDNLNLEFSARAIDQIFFEGRPVGADYSVENWERGTYLYIGPDNFEESENYLSLIDSEFPSWIADEIKSHTEILMAAQEDRWALPAPKKRLTILFAFGGVEGEGLYLKGGALGENLLIFDIRGSDLREPSSRTSKLVARLIGHETTHIFQSRSGKAQISNREAWVSEGHADAMAYDLLFTLGLMDQDDIDKYYKRAVTRCETALVSGPLKSASDRGLNRAHYECGNLIWRGLVTRAPGGSLTKLWEEFVRDRTAPINSLIESLGGSEAATALQNIIGKSFDKSLEGDERNILMYLEHTGVQFSMDTEGQLASISFQD